MGKKKARPTIGLLIHRLEGEYSSQIWRTVSDLAVVHDFNLIVYIGNTIVSIINSAAPENIIYFAIEAEKLDGIITVTSTVASEIGIDIYQNYFKRFQDIPAVSIGIPIEGIPSVLVENKVGMKALINHLIEEHNYTRIAFIKGPESNMEARARYEAYEESLQEHDIAVDPLLVCPGKFNSMDGEEAVRILLDERKVTFDAIAAANDDMAYAALKSLKERGYRIPEDIAVTGFDDDENFRYITPPFTTVHQPLSDLARKSVELLLDEIGGKEIPDIIHFPAYPVIRQSCGCPPIPKKIHKSGLANLSVKNDDFVLRINEQKKEIITSTLDNLGVPSESRAQYRDFFDRFIDNLMEDVINQEANHKVTLTLNEFLSHTIMNEEVTFSWNRAFYSIRMQLLPLIVKPGQKNTLEDIFQNAQLLVGEILQRKEGYRKNQLNYSDSFIRRFLSIMNNIVDLSDLLKVIVNNLHHFGLKSFYLSLYEEDPKRLPIIDWYVPTDSKNLLAIKNEHDVVMHNKRNGTVFPTKKLLPPDRYPTDERFSWIVRALYSREGNYGVGIYSLDSRDASDFVNLHDIICAGLQTIILWETRSRVEKTLKTALDELKFQSQELEDSNQKLAKLDDLKNDFIANITHDFRSPLMIILNTADLGIKYDANTDAKITRRYKTIYDASLKLKTTIDRLLDLAKMDAQGVKLHVKKLPIKAFVESLSDFYRSAVLSTNIKIVDILPTQEVSNFYTDPDKLEEVLNNIISNALKFVNPKDGQITIEVNDFTDHINITVSDNGIGIPQEKLEAIFGRFEQVEGGKDSQYKGTGIGLAFSKQLMDYLKGKIRAESEGPGRGARFVLELKKGRDMFRQEDISDDIDIYDRVQMNRDNLLRLIESDLQEKTQPDDIEVFINELNKDGEFELRKSMILIVEDNKFIREIEKEYLQKAGYKNFIIAKDGKQGIEAAYKYRPDLIICDYNMPVMKGDQFHDELVNNPDFKRIPFIFLTAIADKSIIAERKKKGAVAYLGKPIDENDLQVSVEIHLMKYLEFKETYHHATTDELTKVYNRRTLLKLLQEKMAIRKFRPLSLIFFDIDHFKIFNDTYGHQAGDMVLEKVGHIAKNSLRNYDIAGRYGGEEFLVILQDTDIERASIVAEKLRQNIERIDLEHKQRKLSITASFGVASLTDHESYIANELGLTELKGLYEVEDSEGADWQKIEEQKVKVLETLLNLADRALYQAKATVCSGCGYQSEKSELFEPDACPKCGSKELIKGRNRVILFGR